MTITRRKFLGETALALGGLAGCGRERSYEKPRLRDEYDVCIVGSGFAGTLLGLRLVERKLQTIIIEAGRLKSDDTTSPDLAKEFRCHTGGEIDYPADQARVIGVGGTSAHWTGAVIRLSPNDFRMRSMFGTTTDWPIDFADLDPYYCQAETALLASGFPPMIGEPPRDCSYPLELPGTYQDPAVRLGADAPSLHFFRVALSERGTRKKGPLRLAQEEIPRFLASRYGTILAGHQGFRFATEGQGLVSHVEVRSADGSTTSIRAKVFVLAAGVIESARLLLLSRSTQFPRGLGNEYDLVGRFFNVHPDYLRYFEPRDQEQFSPGNHRTLAFNDQLRQQGLNACQFQLDRYRSGITRIRMQPEVEPRPENRITLSETKLDSYGLPLPIVALSYSERDKRTIENGSRLMEEILKNIPGGSTAGPMVEEDRYHPAGTCRMGFDETGGVVDTNCKVYGLDNLYVSGACVFPTSGTANPTLTVVALTFRLADHISSTFPASQ